ncbi:CatB-related O-acetyltransferase [Orbus wheelerorum]|uniref:CatB-related O-acetyltransferase n=1 Tax=Orbus wheelerorum TaxID=3074111 RepID=UPI00370D91EB
MGFRNWLYAKTGIKLKQFDEITKNIDIFYKERNIKISKLANVLNHSTIAYNCSIDDYSYTAFYCLVGPDSKIGKYCSIAHNTYIGADSHPTIWLSTHPFQHYSIGKNCDAIIGSVTVEHDVWIGANTVILAGLNIGSGAIIAAGAVVTKDVPPYAIVGGVPAKIIKYRFSHEIIDQLLELRWWDFSADTLRDNKIEFRDINKAIKQIQELKNKIGTH